MSIGRGWRRRTARPPWLVLAVVAVVAGAYPAAAAGPGGSDMLGQPQLYVSDGERTLLQVARENNLGLLELLAANPGLDPWVPGEEASVQLPSAHLLPDAAREGIVINLADLRLYYFPGAGGTPLSFPIGVGREGFSTPLGETRIVRKKVQPTWYPTAATIADDPGLPRAVPPGPANPLGEFALYLGWPTYAVHGTNKPWGVGRRVSRGCIRLYPEDIETLFDTVAVGTKVTVVFELIKLGWDDGDLYLEVHPNHEQLDALEATGDFEPEISADISRRVLAAAGTHAYRLDWAVIHAALRQQRGMPVRITR